MLASHRAPWVKYHNIVGLVPERGLLGRLAAGSDGVVAYESATVDDVESELTVPSDHIVIHAHPRAVLEVKRILLENLADLRGLPGPRPYQARAVPASTAARMPGQGRGLSEAPGPARASWTVVPEKEGAALDFVPHAVLEPGNRYDGRVLEAASWTSRPPSLN
jgi:hypothetical protein